MRLIDSGPRDPRHAIELDARLFQALEAGGGEESLRFWESPREAVVVSRFATVARDVHERVCRGDGVPVVRRVSGGGSVVIGPGCLNYSLVLSLGARPELRDVARSYRTLLGAIVAALALPGLGVAGAGDLALHGRKVAGSAQRRGRRALLHHGTILYAFDLRRVDRYLPEPVRQPAYRRGRCHTEFLANAPIAPDAIKAAFMREFGLRSDPVMADAGCC